MLENYEELKTWLIKILIPSMVAVSIKIAIQSREKKISMVQVIVSFVTGVGSAYLFGDYILYAFSAQWQPIVIAIIAISGEKIGYYLMYRFQVDEMVKDFVTKYMK